MNESVGTIFVDLTMNSATYKQGLSGIKEEGLKASRAIEGGFARALESTSFSLRRVAAYAGIAFSTGAIINYARQAALLTARVDTLRIVLGEIGRNAGYTSSEMKTYVSQTEKMGITTQAAMDSIIKMTQAEMDLSKAAKFARVAQDAAVIGNINSSQAFQRMVYAVKTGQPEMLRTIGLNVSFESAYSRLAAQLGKNVTALTESEKVQARMNATLEYGTRIQGAYEAAMGTAGKALNSLSRYTEQVQLKIGEAFQPALKILVDALTEAFKGFGTTLDDFITSGGMREMAKGMAGFAVSGIKAMTDIGSTLKSLINILYEFKSVLLVVATVLVVTKISNLIMAMGLAAELTGIRLGGIILTLARLGGPTVAASAGVVALSGTFLTLGNVLKGLAITIGPWNIALGLAIGLGYSAYSAYKAFSGSVYDSASAIDVFSEKLKKLNKIERESELDYVTAQIKQMEQYAITDKKRFNILGGQERIDDLKYFAAKILATQRLADLEKQRAIKQKAENERLKQQQEDERNKPILDKQRMDSALNIAKSNSADMLDIIRKQNEAEIILLRTNGVDKETLSIRTTEQAISLAEKERDEIIRLAKIESEDRKKTEAGRFEETAFMKAKEVEANNKFNATVRGANLKSLTDGLTDEFDLLKKGSEYKLQLSQSLSDREMDILRGDNRLRLEEARIYGESEIAILRMTKNIGIDEAKKQRNEVVRLAAEKAAKNIKEGESEESANLGFITTMSKAYEEYYKRLRELNLDHNVNTLGSMERLKSEAFQSSEDWYKTYLNISKELKTVDMNDFDRKRYYVEEEERNKTNVLLKLKAAGYNVTELLSQNEKRAAHESKKIRIDELGMHVSYYETISRFSEEAYDLRIRQIKLEAEEVWKATGNQVLAEQYLEERVKQTFIEMGGSADSFFSGVQAGFTQLKKDALTWRDLGASAAGAFKSSLASELGDSIYNILTGKGAGDIGTLGQRVGDAVLKDFSKKLGEMASEKITDWMKPGTEAIKNLFDDVWGWMKSGYQTVIDYVAQADWASSFLSMKDSFVGYLGEMLSAVINFVKETLVKWGVLKAGQLSLNTATNIGNIGSLVSSGIGAATGIAGTAAGAGATTTLLGGTEGLTGGLFVGDLAALALPAAVWGGGYVAANVWKSATNFLAGLMGIGAEVSIFDNPDVFAQYWKDQKQGTTGQELLSTTLNEIAAFKALGWDVPSKTIEGISQNIIDAIPASMEPLFTDMTQFSDLNYFLSRFDPSEWQKALGPTLDFSKMYGPVQLENDGIAYYDDLLGWLDDLGNSIRVRETDWGFEKYGRGGWNPGYPAIFGDQGAEYAAPAQEPERGAFLERTGVADKLREVLRENTNGSPINLQLFFDSHEFLSAMVDAADKNPRLRIKLVRG